MGINTSMNYPTIKENEYARSFFANGRLETCSREFSKRHGIKEGDRLTYGVRKSDRPGYGWECVYRHKGKEFVVLAPYEGLTF